jgi:hypothetical protein
MPRRLSQLASFRWERRAKIRDDYAGIWRFVYQPRVQGSVGISSPTRRCSFARSVPLRHRGAAGRAETVKFKPEAREEARFNRDDGSNNSQDRLDVRTALTRCCLVTLSVAGGLGIGLGWTLISLGSTPYGLWQSCSDQAIGAHSLQRARWQAGLTRFSGPTPQRRRPGPALCTRDRGELCTTLVVINVTI